jgi:hypothetical protein
MASAQLSQCSGCGAALKLQGQGMQGQHWQEQQGQQHWQLLLLLLRRRRQPLQAQLTLCACWGSEAALAEAEAGQRPLWGTWECQTLGPAQAHGGASPCGRCCC